MKTHPENIDPNHELTWSRLPQTRGNCFHIFKKSSSCNSCLSLCNNNLSINDLRECPKIENLPSAVVCDKCLKIFRESETIT